jgi:hypothetical protein
VTPGQWRDVWILGIRRVARGNDQNMRQEQEAMQSLYSAESYDRELHKVVYGGYGICLACRWETVYELDEVETRQSKSEYRRRPFN